MGSFFLLFVLVSSALRVGGGVAEPDPEPEADADMLLSRFTLALNMFFFLSARDPLEEAGGSVFPSSVGSTGLFAEPIWTPASLLEDALAAGPG